MNRIYLFVLIALSIVVSSCNINGAGGELIGVPAKPFRTTEVPYGMVYIPAGSFVVGQTDQDITFAQIAENKKLSVSAFYMDETEITNSEYHQFVNWVRDSIAITDFLNDDKYYIKPKNADAISPDRKYIDWQRLGKRNVSIWGNKKGNAENAKKLEGMYYQADDRVFDRNEIDTRLLKYNFAMLDVRAAIDGRNDKTKRRSDFIFRDTVAVYPDTLVWLSDFAYAQNEPMVKAYFSHPAFNNYPVVGVTWRQARAFTVWRSRFNDAYKDSRKLPRRLAPYQLPTEAEFEYAARGGRTGTVFPWGGPYARNAKGCLMANFKSGRGDYNADGGVYTVHVKSYFPNDFGLYNMAGNVAEWTSSAYDESASAFTHDLNPTFMYEARAGDPQTLKRKVVRGGSWKDIGYFLQNSTRTYEYQDEARSYIGFRCVTASVGSNTKKK